LAARATKRITAARLARLDEILTAYDIAIAADDETAIIDLGHAFHREINVAADAFRLAALLASAVSILPPRFYAGLEGWADSTQDEHPRIVEALHERDAAKATSLMENHIVLHADRLIETLEAQGLRAEPFEPEKPA